MDIQGDLKELLLSQASEEADAAEQPLKIYHCEDCGCRVAAKILNGPSEPMPHHYLAAGGGQPFLGCCPICGGTMFHDLSLDLDGRGHGTAIDADMKAEEPEGDRG